VAGQDPDQEGLQRQIIILDDPIAGEDIQVAVQGG